MRFVADLHIHSHYSVATSDQLRPEYLDLWGRVKGVKVVGAGDVTHPGWLRELQEKLEPAEPGLYRLKDSLRIQNEVALAETEQNSVRFLLSAEISNIYKKYGQIRKVHNLILVPDFETAGRIQDSLRRLGFNITSDGRPILGLDARDLLEMVLKASEQVLLVPAHIWTPWFSVLGANSGFDSVEACFDDLVDHIRAVETGLSSDPPMNWMCSVLDRYTLISNSDAHSPEKLGREANLLDTELSYAGIVEALRTGHSQRFRGTLEFFPQEGKYHYDGHRKCGIRWDPAESARHQGICLVCGKPVTVGVMNRVAQLSDRSDPMQRVNRAGFYSTIPLVEILSEILNAGPSSKKVQQAYFRLVRRLGSEFGVLLDATPEEIGLAGGELVAEAIRRMRSGQIHIQEGYDGQYGVIRVFRPGELRALGGQSGLFQDRGLEPDEPPAPQRSGPEQLKLPPLECDQGEEAPWQDGVRVAQGASPHIGEVSSGDPGAELDTEQSRAVSHFEGPLLIVAGPGTGKTRVLTHRIAHLIRFRTVPPGSILAVTFTNKAADEMRARLDSLLNDLGLGQRPWVGTFHAFGHAVLKRHAELMGRTSRFSVIDESDRESILRTLQQGSRGERRTSSARISLFKQTQGPGHTPEDPELLQLLDEYDAYLLSQNLFDLDDLIHQTVRLFRAHPDILEEYRRDRPWILVDEYQDVNCAQYQLIRCLAHKDSSNLCVIGDPDQAIYGFRGSDARFIRRFLDDYPGAAVYRLNQSYRCTQTILQASPQVLPNGDGLKKELTGLHRGVRLQIVQHPTEKSEAEFVARTIENMLGGVRFYSIDSGVAGKDPRAQIQSLSDFAVLCRIGRQMEAIGKAFDDHGIPYRSVDEVPFFKREPVRSVVDLLRISVCPENRFLRQRLEAAGLPVSNLVFQGRLDDSSKDSIRSRITRLLDCLRETSALKREAYRTDCERLLEMAGAYGDDLEGFLRVVCLGLPADTLRPGTEEVALMTLHAAKGLEFRCVFVVGCEAGLLPFSLFGERSSDPEEERRLLYVGMTRAREFLFLTHARRRFLAGRTYENPRSPFLDRIEKEWVEQSKYEPRPRTKEGSHQLRLF